jgi:hypothetical protein
MLIQCRKEVAGVPVEEVVIHVWTKINARSLPDRMKLRAYPLFKGVLSKLRVYIHSIH